jgi:hypothetical protein
LTKLCDFNVNTSVVYSAAQINKILADFWANRNMEKGATTRVITLSGAVGTSAPTGQGLTDKAALQLYSSPTPPGTAALWTVTTR